MSAAWRLPVAVLVAAGLTALADVGDGGSSGEGAADGGSCAIDVEVLGARDGGVLWVLLFSSAEAASYPTKRQNARARVDVAPVGGVARVSFGPLACGTWAVAVVHDENGNGVLDTGIFRIPREGLGASRNARRMFGPPTFDDAKVVVGPDRARVPINVVY